MAGETEEVSQFYLLPCTDSAGAVESLKTLYDQYHNEIIKARVLALHEHKHFVRWRPIRGDGNCFYRAFAIAYLEILHSRPIRLGRILEWIKKLEAKLQFRLPPSALEGYNLLKETWDSAVARAQQEQVEEEVSGQTMMISYEGSHPDHNADDAAACSKEAIKEAPTGEPSSACKMPEGIACKEEDGATSAVNAERELMKKEEEECMARRQQIVAELAPDCKTLFQELIDENRYLSLRVETLEKQVNIIMMALVSAGMIPPVISRQPLTPRTAQSPTPTALAMPMPPSSVDSPAAEGGKASRVRVKLDFGWMGREVEANNLVHLFRWLTACGLLQTRDLTALYLPEGLSLEGRVSSVMKMGEEAEQFEILALTSILKQKLILHQVDGATAAPEYIFNEDGKEPAICLLFRPGHYDILYSSKK